MSTPATEPTKEQLALADKTINAYIEQVTVHRDLTSAKAQKAIKKWLNLVYSFYDLAAPEIEIAASPYAACKLASTLTGSKQTKSDYCGLSEAGWVASYDFFHQIGELTDAEFKDCALFRDFLLLTWDTILLDKLAIVIARPVALRTDAEGNLHASGQPCIEWADGEKDYAWHGTWITERMACAPHSFSKAEYLDIKNTEERRALSEIAGWDFVLRLLDGKVKDTWVDPATQLRYRLLNCDKDLLLLEKQSPILADGSQPTYLEPVHEDLKTAQAARKWQATNLTAQQCEADPQLLYGTEA